MPRGKKANDQDILTELKLSERQEHLSVISVDVWGSLKRPSIAGSNSMVAVTLRSLKSSGRCEKKTNA